MLCSAQCNVDMLERNHSAVGLEDGYHYAEFDLLVIISSPWNCKQLKFPSAVNMQAFTGGVWLQKMAVTRVLCELPQNKLYGVGLFKQLHNR